MKSSTSKIEYLLQIINLIGESAIGCFQGVDTFRLGTCGKYFNAFIKQEGHEALESLTWEWAIQDFNSFIANGNIIKTNFLTKSQKCDLVVLTRLFYNSALWPSCWPDLTHISTCSSQKCCFQSVNKISLKFGLVT